MEIQISPKEDFRLEDIQLQFVYSKASAEYFIGLGYEGGRCPDRWDWKWDADNRQDSFFLGTVNRGMRPPGEHRAPHPPAAAAGELVQPGQWGDVPAERGGALPGGRILRGNRIFPGRYAGILPLLPVYPAEAH